MLSFKKSIVNDMFPTAAVRRLNDAQVREICVVDNDDKARKIELQRQKGELEAALTKLSKFVRGSGTIRLLSVNNMEANLSRSQTISR